MRAVAIAALSSGQGKTLFTMSLLQWLKKNSGSVRPYKIGPDYIDPKFHEKITGNSSVNLDLYMMSEDELKDVFAYYSTGMDYQVIEGVMGFYDGMDYGTSTYEVARSLNVPTILLISAEGSYTTLVPVLKGILSYRADNTIKGVILNKISSESHYQTITNLIVSEIPEIKVLGWIKKGLNVLSSRHLGLDLTDLDKELDKVSESVMENINTEEMLKFMDLSDDLIFNKEFFADITEDIENKLQKLTISVVQDKAFSFVYTQNLDFIDKYFGKVHRISALNDEEIPNDTDVVYIPGGYVETTEVATILHRAERFKKSLQKIAANPDKKIYAECAGLMFLGEKIQTTEGNWIEGAGLIPLIFEMQKTRQRLGYYKAKDIDNLNIYKGHSFHYSRPAETDIMALKKWNLFKDKNTNATTGGWSNKEDNVLGTYLHSLFFNQPELINKYFIPS